MVCLDEAGAVVRPALLWNDTRSAAGGRRPGRRARRRPGVGRRRRQRARRLVHRHQAALARRAREGQRRARRPRCACRTTGSPGGCAAGSGTGDLADLVTDRSDASGTGYWSPASPASTGPTCSSGRSVATTSRCRACWRPARRPDGPPPGRCSGRARATTPPPRSGSARVPGDVVVSIGTSGVACAVSEVPDRGPHGHGRGVRLRHRRAPAAGVHPQRGAGARRHRRAARRRPRPAGRAGAERAGGGGRAGAGALPGGRADAEPARRDRCAARPDAGHGAPRAPGPRRGGGAAVRARRRRRRAGGGRRPGARGCSWSAAAPGRRPCRPSRRRCSAGRSWCRRRASTSPTGRPARRPGCWRGELPEWEPAGTVVREADPTPAVRARYAEVRDLTAARV